MSTFEPRPTATDRVRLRVGDHEILAPVVTADESAVHLELPEPTGGSGEIVFSHPRGVISLTGTVAPNGDGAVFTIAETRRLEQRREAFRLAVACPVHVVRADGTRLDYRTGDLSLTGVRIVDADQLEDEERLVLEIQLEELGTAQISGQVVRRDELSVGVRFCDLPSAAEHQLSTFIAVVQRRRMRRAA